MSVKFFLFCFIICLTLCIIEGDSNDKEKVSVYYSPGDNASIQFITKKLIPLIEDFGAYIDVQLIPFGKSTIRHGIVTCPHGPTECLALKYHACIIHQKSEIAIEAYTLKCIMKSSDPSNVENIQKCVEKNGLIWYVIQNCASSRRGDEIVFQNGGKTIKLEPEISFVPTVIINEKRCEDLNTILKIEEVLCAQFPFGRNIPGCPSEFDYD